jgi:uncharacterized membrane protein YdjX (TVP38/TMEM64 family)
MTQEGSTGSSVAARRSDLRWWRRQVGAAVSVAAVALLLFAVAEILQIPLLSGVAPLSGLGAARIAVAGPALLVADVLLPVPSSVVMVAHGALFGAAFGTLLSLMGNLGAVLLGWVVGRRGQHLLLGGDTEAQLSRARRALDRWGTAAIIVTRPIPIIAETVMIMAGANGMRLIPVLVAGALGSLPLAIAYAIAGSAAATVVSTSAVFAVLVALSIIALLIGRRRAGAEA